MINSHRIVLVISCIAYLDWLDGRWLDGIVFFTFRVVLSRPLELELLLDRDQKLLPPCQIGLPPAKRSYQL